MMEQLSMFSDPLEEKALRTIRAAIKKEEDIDYIFSAYYGGSQKGYSFQFDPGSKCFYYSDKSFNNYKPEPWVRRKTKKEIREIIGE